MRILLALTLALGAAGCGGDTKTTTIEVPTCPELCEIGASSCEGAVAIRCVEGPDGCGVPEVEACSDAQSCSEGACVDRICPPTACSLDEVTCKDDRNLEICVTGRDGCGVLNIVTCGDRSVCQDGACVGDCVDADGDSYGVGCLAGPDCDDGDADVSPDAEESCNGVDDNCDGEVDETFVELGGACVGGLGACEAPGVLICSEDGTGTACDAVPGPAGPLDLCGNDIDDDCDGEVDEDHPTVGEACVSGLGICETAGVLVCGRDGLGVECDATPGEPAGQDLCNGQDDDCDGDVDEDNPELDEVCTVGVGACSVPGTYICDEEGGTVCNATENAPEEFDLCGNGIDDDCDGNVDNDDPDLGQVCRVGIGACERVGVMICAEDGDGTVCSVEPGEPGLVELCGNGIDDNCNEETDEGFEDLGVGCEVGEGICGNVGAFVCSQDRTELVCSAQEGDEEDEICDGLDNNCNEDIDETFDVGDECEVGVGFCRRTGVNICSLDRLGTVCNVLPGDPLPADLCGNETDDNCDGDVDEGFEDLGAPCTVGLGICQATGTMVCAPGLLGLVCDATPGQDELEICDGIDNNCDGVVDDGEVCGQCVPDGAEPNDTVEMATPVDPGETRTGSICFFDQDHFSLGELEAGQVVVLNLLFSHDDGDIDVAVLRDGAFLNGVQGGISATDNEQVVFVVVDPGVYTFQLGIAGGDGAVDYRLSVVVDDDPCDDDVFEPDDTVEQAMPLAAAETRAMTACASDRPEGGDWFDLGSFDPDTQLDIVATFNHSQGDINMQLWRGDVLVEIADSINNNETIGHLVLDEGNYYLNVEVLGDPPRANDYSVRYTATADVCIDDEIEDDTIGEAALLTPRLAISDRRACADNEDWYRLNFNYAVGQEITINAAAENGRGDVDLELFFGNGTNRVAIAATANPIETLRYRVTSQGSYWVRVTRGAGQPFYRISAAYPQATGCSPDQHESDSFFDIAFPSSPDTTYALTACPPVLERIDFDFLYVGDIAAGKTLTVDVTFDHDEGDVDLAIYRIGDENFTAIVQSADDNEHLEYEVEEGGEFTVVPFLFGSDTDGNHYRVRYHIE